MQHLAPASNVAFDCKEKQGKSTTSKPSMAGYKLFIEKNTVKNEMV